MAIKTAKDKIRALVAGLDHDEAYRLMQAATLRADVLDSLDAKYPSFQYRKDAERLRDLAALLKQANEARDVIEGAEATTRTDVDYVNRAGL